MRCFWLAQALGLALLALPALGEEPSDGLLHEMGLSLGLYDLGDTDETGMAGLDYGFEPIRWDLEPHVGVGSTVGSSVYVYAGVRRHYRLGGRFLATPSFAVSLWEQGGGKDLGHIIEFRSGLVLSRELRSGARIGVGIYHLSNCCIGRLNPGSNELLLRLVLPQSRNRRGAP